MSSEWTDIGVVLAVFIAITAMAIALDRRAEVMVDDGPAHEPYRIFTREFDRMIAARDLPAVLREASPDVAKGYLEKNDWRWRAQIARAEDIYGELAKLFPLEAGEADTLRDAAVLLIIDQSGSMRGEPMAWAAAGVRRLSDELGSRGANVAVAGYTTAGWHGGFARREWRRERRPARPGRLCALLHIVYRPFDSTNFDEGAWRQMLNPDILRENVDGEALEWGADYLKNRPERRRVLLVVSDGAPVDDATLIANGPSYMHRHFLKVRDTLLDAKTPELLAIGVGYRVSEFYPVSREATDAGELVKAGLSLVIGE